MKRSGVPNAVLLTLIALAPSGCATTGGGLPRMEQAIQDGVGIYAGELRGAPGLAELQARLAPARKAALERAQEMTGLSVADDEPYILARLVDPGQLRGGKRSNSAQMHLIRAKGRTCLIASLKVGPLLLGINDLDRLLAHEFTHAVIWIRTRKRARPLPLWIMEGLAMWVAGQRESKVDNFLNAQASGLRKRITDLNAIEDLTSDSLNYVEGALAFEYLERELGPEGIRAVVRDIAGKLDYQDALMAHTKMPWHALKRELDRYIEETLNDQVGEDERGLLDAAIAACEAREYTLALERLDEFLQRFPDSRVVPAVRYRRACCLYALKRHSEAAEEWLGVQRDHLRVTVLQPACAMNQARAYTKAGQHEKAAEAFERYFTYFSYVPYRQLSKAHYYQGWSLLELGRFDQAVAALRKVHRKDKRFYPRAHCRLAKANLKRGDPDAADEVLDDLAKRYPDARCLAKLRQAAEKYNINN